MLPRTEEEAGVAIVGELRAAGLKAVVNVCGTPSAYGALGGCPEAVEAMAALLPLAVDMVELQRLASREIARATGAEAGFVTGCSAAALTLAAAAAITGEDRALVARLPETGEPRPVVVAQGPHDFSCGAPLGQLVALAGARLVLAGDAAGCDEAALATALAAPEVVAVFVIQGAGGGGAVLPLPRVVALARARGVPVVVDGAAEHDLTGAIARGADLFIRSAQKIHRGPTAGILAGRRNLIRACYLQETGIGRAMKAGKEAVAGTIAALRAWRERDDAAETAAWTARSARACERLRGLPGLEAGVEADRHGRGVLRVRLAVDAARAGFGAADLVAWLAAGDPQVIAWPWDTGEGLVYLDPRPASDADMEAACGAIRAACGAPSDVAGAAARLGSGFDLAARLAAWP